MIIYCESPRALSRAKEFIYQLLTCLPENDHRLHKLPEPIPNSEVKLLLARLVLPWGTRWESRVLFSSFAFVCLNFKVKVYCSDRNPLHKSIFFFLHITVQYSIKCRLVDMHSDHNSTTAQSCGSPLTRSLAQVTPR